MVIDLAEASLLDWIHMMPDDQSFMHVLIPTRLCTSATNIFDRLFPEVKLISAHYLVFLPHPLPQHSTLIT